MRVPEEILNSVLFLEYRVTLGGCEREVLIGTAFVVSVAEGDSLYRYLVTARHSVLRLAEKVQEIRVNSSNNRGPATIKLEGKWWFHPTEEKLVDVAICPFAHEGIDVTPIPASMFLTDDAISDFYIGPGDEVSITGLFTKLTGESKNIPIVRRGSVAMLPDTKIPSVFVGDGTRDIEGYLIEVRSVGGLSGSPAFVRAPIGVNYNVHTRSGKQRIAKAHFQGDYFLLGLCQGHWEIPPDQKNRIDFSSANKGEDSINLGIAIVVPAKKILEVLNHPELVAMRHGVADGTLAESVTKPSRQQERE